MILTPQQAADIVTGDAHKHLFFLPGFRDGKFDWLSDLSELLIEADADLFTFGRQSRGFDGIASDILSLMQRSGWKASAIYVGNPTNIDERIAIGLSTVVNARFHYVSNFLTDEERQKHRPIIEPVTPDFNLPPAIIVDLDGTLADSSHRAPFGASVEEILEDKVIHHVSEVVFHNYNIGRRVIYLTARGENDWELPATTQWLMDKGLFDRHDYHFHLYSRDVGDNRDDVVVKYELFNKHIRGKYDVRLALDDRPKVCRMWQELGIPLLANQAYIRGEF